MFLSGGAFVTNLDKCQEFLAAHVNFGLGAELNGGQEGGDEADPTGSPRNEQTVEIATEKIIARVLRTL
jgi:hypothetical protein